MFGVSLVITIFLVVTWLTARNLYDLVVLTVTIDENVGGSADGSYCYCQRGPGMAFDTVRSLVLR